MTDERLDLSPHATTGGKGKGGWEKLEGLPEAAVPENLMKE